MNAAPEQLSGPNPSSRSGRIADVVALAASAAVALVLLWPLVRAPAASILDGVFAYSNMWTFEHMARSLLIPDVNAWFTDDFRWPDGGTLPLVGWWYGLCVALGALLGADAVSATNIVLWANIVGASWCAYRLARACTGGTIAPIVAGLYFGVSPVIQGFLANGQFEEVSHVFVPLPALLLLRLRSSPGPGTAVLLGAVLALLVTTAPYLALIDAVLLVGMTLAAVAQRQDEHRGRFLFMALLAAASAFLLAMPFLQVFQAASSSPDALLHPAFSPSPMTTGLQEVSGATLVGWFRDEASGVTPPEVCNIHYLGLIPLGLTVLGLAVSRSWRRGMDGAFGPRFWVASGVVYFVIALGYYLVFQRRGVVAHLDGQLVPLPLYWLYLVFPQVSRATCTYRFAVGVSLSLAMLLAFALRRLEGSALGRAWLALAGVAILSEVAWTAPSFPVRSAPATPPRVYLDLASRGGPGGVMVVPFRIANASRPTKDGRPALLAMEKSWWYQRFDGLPRLNGDLGFLHARPDDPCEAWFDAVADGNTHVGPAPCPREQLTWVVLHEGEMGHPSPATWRGNLSGSFTLVAKYPEDEVTLWENTSTRRAPTDAHPAAEP